MTSQNYFDSPVDAFRQVNTSTAHLLPDVTLEGVIAKIY